MERNNKSKDKLKSVVKSEVTHLFEQVLDYSQVACSSPETYKILRGKILRLGNDCIRNLHTSMDDYVVEFVPSSEDVIVVKQN